MRLYSRTTWVPANDLMQNDRVTGLYKGPFQVVIYILANPPQARVATAGVHSRQPIASYVPARRAMRIDVLRALRQE